ncbi:conserved hypothetical protein [Leishmania major strain Friedlin]|uniref:Vasohibin-like protein n=1 Tax=Leishmania major TaxID=5664 RepID=E9AD23_LEIMA|nr:conserved hypothetical protein [Leishmania major strain Friedlin]CAG9576646.1 Vasohibin_-_putative [Leishmania major strain Friedlin]CBZ12106.1 conserved hypothetical protein [Leishmania major strain Friedlin]|eukprot:XP_003721852.1 conserved hypothetical protein [Leishmania major strain Friedlin]
MSDKVLAIVEQLSQQNPFHDQEDLPDPPRPSETAIPRDRPSAEQVPFIQKQISILSYNHLPRTFFSLEKHRSLQSILFTAKEVLCEALPIRCLEATFVALHYTQTLRDIDRIPLSFKSEANGNFYRHIVLVLRTRSAPALYGALGLSRKPTLMYKPLAYHSLFDVVMDYKREYEALGHELLDIKLGIAVTHDERSRYDPCWRFIALKLDHYRDGTKERSLKLSSTENHKPTSPRSLQTHARKTSGHVANDSFSSSNGGPTALPPLSPGPPRVETSAHCINGDVSLERSAKAVCASHSETVAPAYSEQFPPLSTCDSTLSPRKPTSSVSPSLTHPPSTTDAAVETYAPLAQLLSNYMRLLPTISEQYYKGIATVDNNNRALKLCFMDLDTAERDSGAENQRRLQLIGEMQSPLSAEAKRVAANRTLKPPKRARGIAKNASGSGSSGAVGRRKTNKRAPLALLPSVGAADGKRAIPSVAVQPHRPPQVQPSLVAPDISYPSASLCTSRSAESERAASLSALLTGNSHISRPCMPFERIVIDAQNTGSSASPLCSRDGGTEGCTSPCDADPDSFSEDAFAAPPLTPRNYDERKPLSHYEPSLRSTSSASDLFSTPFSLRAAAMCSPRR